MPSSHTVHPHGKPVTLSRPTRACGLAMHARVRATRVPGALRSSRAATCWGIPLAGLEAAREAAAQERGGAGAGVLEAAAGGGAGAPPAEIAVEAARAKLERACAGRAAPIAELGRRAAGPAVPGSRRDRPRAGVEDYCLVKAARAALAKAEARAAEAAERKARQKESPGPVRNIACPDSRLMPVRGGGFIQGYNAQNVTSEDKPDYRGGTHLRHHRHPMVRADARRRACRAICPRSAPWCCSRIGFRRRGMPRRGAPGARLG